MSRSNCVFFALPKWLAGVKAGEETYLVLRFSRIRWGFFHMLLGKMDPKIGQIALTSYKPPPGHKKTGFQPVFNGTVVEGDADTKAADLT